MQFDIVIIGSGISGLTAAAVLAKKGKQVVVVEKEDRIGGALKQFKRSSVSFDVGFHYTGCLGENEILTKLWRYCGSLKHLHVIPFPAHGSDRLYISNSRNPIDAFFSYKKQITELLEKFPHERDGIELYFKTVQDICRNNPFYNLDLGLTDFLRGYKSSITSVKQFLSNNISSPELQAALASPSILYGISTDNVSIDIHAMVAHGYYSGAYSVKGGGQSIVDGFKKSCTDMGVSFLESETVKNITYNNQGVTGVVTGSSKILSCKQVIYTGHPSNIIQLVAPEVFRPAYRKRLSSLKNTLSMNIVFGTVENPSKTLEWNNHIYLPLGPNPFDIKFTHFKDRVLMLTSTERESSVLQPTNKSVILLQLARWEDVTSFEASKPGSRPQEYQRYKIKIRNNMIALAQQHWGTEFSSFQPLTMGTPLTFRDELSAPEGCAYGASHSLDQYTPDIRTRLPGLLLSGQSTLMTGVVGSSLAGFISAGHIVGLEPLWEELKRCS